MTAPAIGLARLLAARPGRRFQRRDLLPFVASRGRGNGIDCWAVESTGNYTRDCELGREYGRAFLVHMTWPNNGDMTLLSDIAADMAEKGERFAPGIRVGFMSEVSEAVARWSIADAFMHSHLVRGR